MKKKIPEINEKWNLVSENIYIVSENNEEEDNNCKTLFYNKEK